MNFYNENDKRAAAWLRELIRQGLIPPGVVDERSIADLKPHDLAEFTQCHFFAGVGGWSLALQLAGWPADRPVWTGSCPCQPFSTAGAKMGRADPRHLWPAFRRLINRAGAGTVFGEQVASPDGREWLAGVSSDLEVMGYSTNAADLCSAGVGAPNIRQRLYWVSHATSERRNGGAGMCGPDGRRELEAGGSERLPNAAGGRLGIDGSASGSCGHADELRAAERLSDSEGQRRIGRSDDQDGGRRECASGHCGETGRLGCSDSAGSQPGRTAAETNGYRSTALAAGRNGFWDDWTVQHFTDGKTRRIKPGLECLVDGLPGRVAMLRGYGNAINPHVAAQFIRATEEARAQHLLGV